MSKLPKEVRRLRNHIGERVDRVAYERRFPEHRNDNRITFAYARKMIEVIAAASNLPPHQYSANYARIADYLDGMPTEPNPVHDTIWYDKTHNLFGHMFKWHLGNIRFDNERDISRAEEFLARDGFLTSVDITAGFARMYGFTGLRISAMMCHSSDLLWEELATIPVPVNPLSTEFDVDHPLLPVSLYLGLGDYDKGSVAIRGGTVLQGVANGSFKNFYFLHDDDEFWVRHFFMREQINPHDRRTREPRKLVRPRLVPAFSQI